VPPEELRALRRRLLAWFDMHRRDLPWRVVDGIPDPYHVWVSEVMLQQTRVETVRPYYVRWLERFPTLEDLARASPDDVLRAWEGLGYYSRARNLHRAVREVADREGGRVPADPDRFRALPGVGRYTAGAVMSIAFGRQEPIVDGNVRRVFARWRDEETPLDAEHWALAEQLVQGDRPGDLNQSVMELGATVCTPRSPRCGDCPVGKWCGALAAGTQQFRPARRRARPIPTEECGVAIVRSRARFLLVRRPEGGRLGGLWEFPGATTRPGELPAEAAIRAAEGLAGVRVSATTPLGRVEQALTHVRVVYHAFNCSVEDSDPLDPSTTATWVAPGEMSAFALSRGQHRLALLATGEGTARPGTD